MANQFVKPDKVVKQGLGLLQHELILSRLVQRRGIGDFKGAKDDTINIRVASILKGREYEWRTRNSKITVDDLNQFVVPVKLDKHAYNAVKVTDEELTLDIDDWGEEVALPQIRAVAEKLEGYVATAMEDANYRHEVTYTPEPDNDNDRSFSRALNAARKHLNTANVPQMGRKVLLGANVEEEVLNAGVLQDVDRSGSDGVLREARIGRLSGFDVIGNVNSVDPDFAVAFHPTAFVLGNVAPEVPKGVSRGAQMDYEGLAMRWINDYDSDILSDRSVYSSFAGASSVEDGRNLDPEASDEEFGDLTEENVRAVRINFTAGS